MYMKMQGKARREGGTPEPTRVYRDSINWRSDKVESIINRGL